MADNKHPTPPHQAAPPPKPAAPSPTPPASSPPSPSTKPPADLPPKTENYPPPEDFHLAKPGSRDYVAGQPADEEELAKTETERTDKIKSAQEAARQAEHKATDTHSKK